jgi:Flp pilus assembly protein TadG
MHPVRGTVFIQEQSGAVFVETALVLSLLIFTMVGIVDFAFAYSRLTTAQKSLKNATRYLATLPRDALCGTPQWGLSNAQNLAVYGQLTASPGRELIPDWTTARVTLDASTCAAATLTVIRLNADFDYNAIMWQAIPGLPGSITLTASHEERWIGE